MFDRAATAIRRNGNSRPLALSLANDLLQSDDRLLDYGCGHGEDVEYLRDRGHEATGWDPFHNPDTPREPADIVLCSYVLNVIESPAERCHVLREVYKLSERVAVIAVRTDSEKAQMKGAHRHGDGWITSKNTFQKLWSQSEARQFIEGTLDVPPVALAPGVFAVFKTPAFEEHWREASGDRIRRAQIHRYPPSHRPRVFERDYDQHREAYDALWTWVANHERLPERDEVPPGAWPAVASAGSVGRAGRVLRHIHGSEGVRRAGKREITYDQNQDAFDVLWEWMLTHGRLPDDQEVLERAAAAVEASGSVSYAGLVLRHVFGDEPVEEAAKIRREDLLVRFAIARLRRRPRFNDLPGVVQRDVKCLFGSYKAACEQADALLFGVGDAGTLRTAARRTDIGKVTSDAVYVHRTAVPLLPPEFVVFDACAQVIAGTITEANIVKFHLDKPRTSYLVYPNFDEDPHPALAESWVADLRSLDLRAHDYRNRENPPVLHRKELLVPTEHPRHETYARLTAQEERHGLLNNAESIGTRHGWTSRLASAGWQTRGHRLVRSRK